MILYILSSRKLFFRDRGWQKRAETRSELLGARVQAMAKVAAFCSRIPMQIYGTLRLIYGTLQTVPEILGFLGISDNSAKKVFRMI